MRAPLLWIALAGAAAAIGGCRERAAPAEEEPAEETARAGRLSFDRERAEEELSFRYADLAGRFRTASSPHEVPESSRKVVRVIDPTAPSSRRGDDDLVYVVDLSRPGEDGTWTAEPIHQERFAARAIAALPPGPGSRITLAAPPADPEAQALDAPGGVILYGTSWCGACRRARAFLEEEAVELTYHDVEKDPVAAAELAARAARAGVIPDRVPVACVRGTLVIGFDRSRLETLLGEPI